MRVEFRWCSHCSTKTLFEQPPCEDGHGADCPDLACVECGSAIVLRDLLGGEPAQKTTRAA
jgi:hypothetical protein